MSRSGNEWRLVLLIAGVFLIGAPIETLALDSNAAYETPILDASELANALASTCRDALTEKRSVLLEFSAPWCSDCLALHSMKQEAALARELSKWPHLVINVGHFDQHRDLLAAFDVESIAHWLILVPTDCRRTVTEWPRRGARTLEPDSGEERDVSPGDLARWLRGLRNW